MNKISFLILITISLFILTSFTITGKIVSILDGDTIILLDSNNEQIRVRLEGIDCPEKSQPFGQMAKQATSSFIYGKEVRIITSGKDRYGRTIGFIYIDDICVNKELLRLGLAWHYKAYNNDPELAKLEEQARASKIGIWSQTEPIAPWDYRKKKEVN